MAVTSLFRRHKTPTVESVAEAATRPAMEPGNMPVRAGYEYGIPKGGVKGTAAQAWASGRRAQLDELHQAYLACSWASTCIDTIARSVTAAGLQIVPDHGDVGKTKPEPVLACERLFRFTNAREDMVQLLRSTVTDLLVFGDAFIEVAWLLGRPVAMWTLDAATMSVQCDDHGEVTGYTQDIDGQRKADFEPNQVIHISLDSPRGGIYGVSPTQKLLLPITQWLFVQACVKERFRRGDPHDIAVALHPSMQEAERNRWLDRYLATNQGPRAQGMPIVTVGEGTPPVHELGLHKLMEWLDVSTQLRDTIISGYGCTPSKVGVIESGNLGGGTGEAQDKNFRINTTIPISALILEKVNYHVLQRGFGVTDWHCTFPEIDMRDSAVVEKIRDTRLRNGSLTLNAYRAEIEQYPVPGGDDAVLVDRQNMVLWSDLAAMSKAEIQGKAGAGADVAALLKASGVEVPPGLDDSEEPGTTPQGQPPAEAVLRESYHRRVRQLIRELDAGVDPWTARRRANLPR